MISSRLLDEGVVEGIPGNPRLLAEPGVYQFNGLEVSGVSTDHDRLSGRQFGTNVVWKWNQSGINVVHMGGIASPITVEQQILIGRPDVALIPVGGGPKAYTPEEAVQAVRTLNPKVVIPTHYRTQAADANTCDIVALDGFLTLMEGSTIQRVSSDTTSIRRSDLPESGTRVTVLSYSF
jgi:L-ascorbate metabolism protein UlaG (beta-lactamase superfamily)